MDKKTRAHRLMREKAIIYETRQEVLRPLLNHLRKKKIEAVCVSNKKELREISQKLDSQPCLLIDLKSLKGLNTKKLGIPSIAFISEADELITCADTALYIAKNSGRNRVEVYRKQQS